MSNSSQRFSRISILDPHNEDKEMIAAILVEGIPRRALDSTIIRIFKEGEKYVTAFSFLGDGDVHYIGGDRKDWLSKAEDRAYAALNTYVRDGAKVTRALGELPKKIVDLVNEAGGEVTPIPTVDSLWDGAKGGGWCLEVAA